MAKSPPTKPTSDGSRKRTPPRTSKGAGGAGATGAAGAIGGRSVTDALREEAERAWARRAHKAQRSQRRAQTRTGRRKQVRDRDAQIVELLGALDAAQQEL